MSRGAHRPPVVCQARVFNYGFMGALFAGIANLWRLRFRHLQLARIAHVASKSLLLIPRRDERSNTHV
jgi:hypothetical protein